MKQSFWIYNPLILIDKRYIKDIFPLDSMKESEKLNALTRLTIMLSIISYIITNSIYTIVSCVISIVAIVLFHKKMDCGEGMSDYTNMDIMKNECELVNPKETNPMMNVLLTDIADNPNRCAAKPSYSPEVKSNIDESAKASIISGNADERLFRSTDDEMQYDFSMRNFHTTPNTEIPNAQTKFAEWCYGDMPSRKEGTYLE